MKKIVITGATSMIGTALTKVAVKNGTEVYAIIRHDTQRKNRLIDSPLVHPIYGDLEHLREINGLTTDCDVFYHFAWVGTSKTTRDDAWTHEKNIRYTLEAVELAEKIGCKRFVGAGSQAEYGPVYDSCIDENTKYSPVIAYGIAKYAAGILSRKLCEKKGISHIWGRIFSVYGPHDNEGTMLDYAIGCFLKGKTAHFSASTQLWNYIYEDDAGEIFYRLGSKDVPSGTYFVANPESMQLKEYIKILMETYGAEAKAEFALEDSSPLPDLSVDMEKTIKAVQFTSRVNFKEGISKMIEAKKAFKICCGEQP